MWEQEEIKKESLLKVGNNFLIIKEWDPSKNSVLYKEQGFVTLSIFSDKLESSFYSTSKKKVRDKVTMYHVKKENHFPAYLWVFFGLLILFAVFVLAWVGRMLWIKLKKQDSSEQEKPLIQHH